jgi:hypothetical protein
VNLSARARLRWLGKGMERGSLIRLEANTKGWGSMGRLLLRCNA